MSKTEQICSSVAPCILYSRIFARFGLMFSKYLLFRPRFSPAKFPPPLCFIRASCCSLVRIEPFNREEKNLEDGTLWHPRHSPFVGVFPFIANIILTPLFRRCQSFSLKKFHFGSIRTAFCPVSASQRLMITSQYFGSSSSV